MSGEVTSYHPNYNEAKAAQLAFMIRYGDSAEYSMISQPNHDRPTYKFEGVYDEDRFSSMRSPCRRDPWSGLGL